MLHLKRTHIWARRQTDKQTARQTNRRTNKQTDRQTDRQTDKQTNRQTNRQTIRLSVRPSVCLSFGSSVCLGLRVFGIFGSLGSSSCCFQGSSSSSGSPGSSGRNLRALRALRVLRALRFLRARKFQMNCFLQPDMLTSVAHNLKDDNTNDETFCLIGMIKHECKRSYACALPKEIIHFPSKHFNHYSKHVTNSG